jgi:hypothetical protein
MILRVSLVILFICFLNGCSNQGAEQNIDEVSSEPIERVLTESNPVNISVVCGVLSKVDDFDSWLSEYKKVAQGTIILLRMVDDPSVVMVFEGGESLAMMEGRAEILTNDEFSKTATVLSDPIVSYFDVQYMSTPEKDYKHYVAFMFELKDINNFLESLKTDLALYAEYGLTPMGVGTNPHNSEQVYMILTLEDFVSFRKRTNSPREFRRIIKKLNLPEDAMMLDWAETTL